MISPEKQARILRDPFPERPELLGNRLMDRLQSCKPIADDRGVPAENLIVGVVDDAKEPARAVLARPELLPVGSPHPIWLFGADRPVIRATRPGPDWPHRRQETVGLHQPEVALPRGTDSLSPEPGPDLLVPLRVESGGGKILPYRPKERLIRDQGLRTGSRLHELRTTRRVPRCRRQPSHLQHQPHRVGSLLKPHFDERPPLDRMNWSFFSCSSSSIACCPIFFSSAAIRTSSRVFPFKPATPAAMKSSRHRVNVSTVTSHSRLTASINSPRRRRSTTSAFFAALQRPCFSSISTSSSVSDSIVNLTINTAHLKLEPIYSSKERLTSRIASRGIDYECELGK